jgi:hypothetical protein
VDGTGAIAGGTDGQAVGFFDCAVCVQVVPSPSRVCDDRVSGDEGGEEGEEGEEGDCVER